MKPPKTAENHQIWQDQETHESSSVGFTSLWDMPVVVSLRLILEFFSSFLTRKFDKPILVNNPGGVWVVVCKSMVSKWISAGRE